MSDNAELMQRFRTAAMKFIEVVDSAPRLEAETFLVNVSHSMAELYSIALALPPVEPETTGTDETKFQADKRDELRRSLQEKIGSLDTYWQIFDSTGKEEPVQGSLALDISEIYFDLKQSLELEETGAPKSDVLFDWRLDFRSHRGRHVLRALAAINARYSYVFHYYRHLMTKQEHLAYRNLMRTRRMTGRTDVAAQAKARSMWQDPKLTPLSDDPEVLHLASAGLQVFVTRTVQRILAEHPDKVAFNNCPRCSALARTPRARQCRFCGFDWHAV